MKTKKQITYIILERGTEDIELWNELNKIIAELKIKSYKNFAKKYPLIYELKNNLKAEHDDNYI